MDSHNHRIITVGRRIGAGGLQIAGMLSQRLGIQMFDRELMAEAAKEYGLDPEIFEKRDEKSTWNLKSLFGMHNNLIMDEDMFKMQSEVMLRKAAEQDCIFVGRCADYVLRDCPNLFSVFITAPLEYRVKRIASIKGWDESQARSWIEKSEKSRASYYNYYTFKTWGDSASYDLCINSEAVGGIENSVDLIIEAMEKEK